MLALSLFHSPCWWWSSPCSISPFNLKPHVSKIKTHEIWYLPPMQNFEQPCPRSTLAWLARSSHGRAWWSWSGHGSRRSVEVRPPGLRLEDLVSFCRSTNCNIRLTEQLLWNLNLGTEPLGIRKWQRKITNSTTTHKHEKHPKKNHENLKEHLPFVNMPKP